MSDKKLRVLHFSPHHEDCGIAVYQENYLAGMEGKTEVENAFFETSPFETIGKSSAELQPILDNLRKELKNYDILHIQHDFSLFSAEFPSIVAAGKAAGKKVIVSMHASPNFFIKKEKLTGLGPHSVVHFLRQMRFRLKMIKFHITPLMDVDLVLVHNEATRQGLERFGVPSDRIQKLAHPVYEIPTPPVSTEIAKKLNKQKGDIIFCTVGFIHKHKGVFDAVKALKFLPDNYKLAVVGGIHATSDDVGIYNRLCDTINTLGLRDRVYITGYAKTDEMLDGFIRECDVCLYPYDRDYYSNVSSGALSRGFANDRPIIAYPTETFKEVAASNHSIVLTDTFAYYELARELQRIDLAAQAKRSTEYAKKMAWPKMAQQLAAIYQEVAKA